MMNVGIHFSNWYWKAPTDDMFRRLFLAWPDTIKTCLFHEIPNNRWSQIDVHRRLRTEHPGATIIARLFADMDGETWSVDKFVSRFAPRMTEIMDYTPWFEVHNEPDIEREVAGYSEGWGRSSADAEAFNVWMATVVIALRNAVPGCKLVFPGQWVFPGYVEWWRRVMSAIRMCDAWGVHAYWQHHNVASLDWGACYEIAHKMLPTMPIYVTEFGDATPDRSPAEKMNRYWAWYHSLPPYIQGSALYIMGGTPDWAHFEVNEDMARKIGEIPRDKPPPVIQPPAEGGGMFKLVRPIPSHFGRVVSQVFGANPDVYEQFGLAGHNGLDYAIPIGTPVYAAHGGTTSIGNDPAGYGLWVRVKDDLRETIYAHLDQHRVGNGKLIMASHQIGISGNTGFSTGPHLHFGLKFHKGRNPAYRDWWDPVIFRL